jgi:hypothetical protein
VIIFPSSNRSERLTKFATSLIVSLAPREEPTSGSRDSLPLRLQSHTVLYCGGRRKKKRRAGTALCTCTSEFGTGPIANVGLVFDYIITYYSAFKNLHPLHPPSDLNACPSSDDLSCLGLWCAPRSLFLLGHAQTSLKFFVKKTVRSVSTGSRKDA